MGEKELLENANWVRSLARGLLRDPCMAEDLAQDVMAAALEGADRGVRPGRMRAWLGGITRNLAHQTLRREGGRPRVEAAAARAEAMRESTDRAELHHQLTSAVLELDEIYRTVLLMRFYDDLAPREIAHRLGLPGPTVRKRLSRAIEQVHTKLSAHPDFSEGRWLASLVSLSRGAGPRRAIPLGQAGPVLAATLGLVLAGAWFAAARSGPGSPEGTELAKGELATPAIDPGGGSGSVTAVPAPAPTPTVSELRIVTQLGDAVGGTPVGRVIVGTDGATRVERIGSTGLDGGISVEGPIDGLYLLPRAAPPLAVGLETDSGSEDGVREATVDAGSAFIGAVVVDAELTRAPLTFQLHLDPGAVGGDSPLPEALLRSDLVKLTAEGDLLLESTTGPRGAFYFWGIPDDTQVLLTPPPGMRFDSHPFGERFGEGEAVELYPPRSTTLFGVSTIEEESPGWEW